MAPSASQTWVDGWMVLPEQLKRISGRDKRNFVFEWIEQGLEMLTCDDNHNLRDPSLLEAARQSKASRRDYAQLHDDLLESLLREQAEQALRGSPCGDSASDEKSASSASTFQLRPHHLRRSSSTDADLRGSSTLSQNPAGEGGKRRQLKLHRHRPHVIPKGSPNRQRQQQIAPSPRKPKYSGDDESSACLNFSLLRSSGRSLPPAESFLSPHVRMQKDKGKGEQPGADICARGPDMCLTKLRQKMELLTQVAFEGPQAVQGRPGSAHMKRRKALVAEENAMYTETRSVIELRMGFLSMQYGMLFRWSNGKVQLIVLRKMCSDSFYKTLKVHRGQQSHTTVTVPVCGVFESALNLSGNNHAIVEERNDGMEVSLLEPPYRVSRPDEFQPSLLKLSVLCIEGWKDHDKSSLSLQFHVNGIVEKSRLTYHNKRNIYVPAMPGTMEWEVRLEGQMDILLYEHRRPRHRRKRLVRRIPVPVSSLTPQPTPARPRKLVLPLNDQGAKLVMLVAFHSDYAHWLQKEAEARKREDERSSLSGFPWNSGPFVGSMGRHSTKAAALEKPEGSSAEFSLYELCCVW